MARNVERQCAILRETKPAWELLRFVKGPDDVLVVDLKEKLPGRGVWITATRSHLIEGMKKNVFARSLKEKVTYVDHFEDRVEELMKHDALGALSISRKAGALVLGHHKVAEALERGGIAAVIQATDGAQDSLRKLRNAANRIKSNDIPLFRVFSAQEMSQATGQLNCVHAALYDKPGAQTFITSVTRLLRYNSMPCETL